MTPWNRELFIDGEWTSEGADGGDRGDRPGHRGARSAASPRRRRRPRCAAIEAARRAFDEGPWPWMKPAERAAKLVRMAEILESRAAELRELIVAETGSAGFITDFVQAAGSIGMFRSNAAIAEHTFPWVEAEPPTGGPTGVGGSAIVREPIGVVAAITPFNFPFMLNTVKVAPALAVGCTVVLKPHPWTPLDAMMIADAAAEADIPPGVLNVISGHGEVGDELTSQPDGRHGHLHRLDRHRSPDHGVGRADGEEAAARARRQERTGRPRRRVARTTPARSASGWSCCTAARAACCRPGCCCPSTCSTPTRRASRHAGPAITIGDPRDDDDGARAAHPRAAARRVEGYVASGLDQGAELLCGGKRPDGFDRGFFYEPTVFIGTNDMRIAQEEIFGPVLTVIPYCGERRRRRAPRQRLDLRARRRRRPRIDGPGVQRRPPDPSRQRHRPGRRSRAASRRSRRRPGSGMGHACRPASASRAPSAATSSPGLGREWGRHGLEDFTEIKHLIWS